jgi:hypothetical protein
MLLVYMLLYLLSFLLFHFTTSALGEGRGYTCIYALILCHIEPSGSLSNNYATA